MSRSKILSATLLALSFGAAPVHGQAVDWNPSQFLATREELVEMLHRYEQAAQSTGYSSALRGRAQHEAALIRQRLTEGDFRVGDEIALIVESEPTLSDTLVVTPSLTARLPSGDSIQLRGVLRSEVQNRLAEKVARVVKNPSVRAETFLRLAVVGGVSNQGFYVVRSDALLVDLLARAGGISSTADLTSLRIERENKRIWEGSALQDALAEGRTIDQLSLRAGDQLVVPTQKVPGTQGNLIRNILFALGPVMAVLRLLTR